MIRVLRLIAAAPFVRLAMWRAPDYPPDKPLRDCGWRGAVGAIGVYIGGSVPTYEPPGPPGRERLP